MIPDAAPLALWLSLLAGCATLLGFALSVLVSERGDRLLSLALAFAGGAMIFVAFGEILGKAAAMLEPPLGADRAGWVGLAGFFGGIGLSFLLDRALQLHRGPGSGTRGPTGPAHAHEEAQFSRMGTFAAVAIGLHNLPEGAASFAGGLDPGAGRYALPFAIALHNVPEGIAIAVPIWRATRSRARAFAVTLVAALAEPVGALLAWGAVAALAGSLAFGIMFAAVAGIMVYIAIDELLPAARQHGDDASATAGFVLGMGVMAVSLQLLQ